MKSKRARKYLDVMCAHSSVFTEDMCFHIAEEAVIFAEVDAASKLLDMILNELNANRE